MSRNINYVILTVIAVCCVLWFLGGVKDEVAPKVEATGLTITVIASTNGASLVGYYMFDGLNDYFPIGANQ